MPPPADDQTSVSDSPRQERSKNERSPKVVSDQYIVVFKDQGEGDSKIHAAQKAVEITQSLASEYSINSNSVLSQYQYALKGFAAELSPGQVKKLKKDPRVDHISPNKIFSLNVSSVSQKKRGKN